MEQLLTCEDVNVSVPVLEPDLPEALQLLLALATYDDNGTTNIAARAIIPLIDKILFICSQLLPKYKRK
jgi:hypothetical protein